MEESVAMDQFFVCYGNISRQCDCIEQQLFQRCSAYMLTTLLKTVTLCQSEFYKISTSMRNAAISELSGDILSLEQRTKLRLAKLSSRLRYEIESVTSIQAASIPQTNEGPTTSALNQKPLYNDEAISSEFSHLSNLGKPAKELPLQLLSLDANAQSVKITHPTNVRDGQIQPSCAVKDGDTTNLNDATTSTMASHHNQAGAVTTCRSNCRSVHSKHCIQDSQFSAECSHLVHQRAELEHKIKLAKQDAERKALESSHERLRQMDLEKELLNKQREIDEMSCTERYSTGIAVYQMDDTKYKIHSKPTYSECPRDIDVIAKTFADAINLNKLPVPEPPVFYGDPLEYPVWKSSFDTLIGCKRIDPGEKIHYLKRYLGGEAKSCIEGMFLFNTETAYIKARDLLQARFGSDFAIAEAFREKLYSWQYIADTDSAGLRKYSDFLQQCDLAKQCIRGLDCLDDCRENRMMLTKLPDYVIVKWNRIISEFDGYFPPFSTFAVFMAKEAEVACNPITSLNAVRALSSANRTVSVDKDNTLASHQNNTTKTNCRYCQKTNHKLHTCNEFMLLNPEERSEFLDRRRLCFGCLEFGHLSKDCKLKKTCKVCKKRHPTCLHGDYAAIFKNNGTEQADETVDDGSEMENDGGSTEIKNLQVSQGYSNHGMIVPVYVSSIDTPHNEILTYALLDTQSDATFVLSSIGDAVTTNKAPSTVKLSTITSCSTEDCLEYRNLQVRGFNYDAQVPLPITYSRNDFPVKNSHIPQKSTVMQWPHFKRLDDQIPELLNCGVGLLIGYNCPQALAPRDFISGEGNVPYALKTLLGWSIVGTTDMKARSDMKQSSQRVMSLITKSKALNTSFKQQSFSQPPNHAPKASKRSRSTMHIHKNIKAHRISYDKGVLVGYEPVLKMIDSGAHDSSRSADQIKVHCDLEDLVNKSSVTQKSIVDYNSNRVQTDNILHHKKITSEINLVQQVYREECKCTCR